MDEAELYRRVYGRTGIPEAEVAAAARELFAQAFVMAMERGGRLVVPRFATFRCRPGAGGRMRFAFRPRSAEELIAAEGRRRTRQPARRRSGADGHARRPVRLLGESYAPQPAPAPAAAAKSRRGGFLSRLLGLGGD
jgi:hypothetical protein